MIISRSANVTKKIGGLLAKEINASKLKINHSFVIGLRGNLGAGKTAFIQGFARAFGIKKITSPTFLIIKNYQLKHSNYANLFHIDTYRINKFKELLALDFKNIIKNKQNLTIIEWADKIKKFLPASAIWIKFEHGKTLNQRIIKISDKFIK